MGGQREALTNKLVYVARASAKGVADKAPEADLLAGEMPAAALEAFQALLAEVFVPLLAEQASWGRCTDAQADEFRKARPDIPCAHCTTKRKKVVITSLTLCYAYLFAPAYSFVQDLVAHTFKASAEGEKNNNDQPSMCGHNILPWQQMKKQRLQ